ncbi:MAG: arginine--tRNA ligase [Patescibacteria group bacterium]|nr:arginine--tRNA ligase [Patescibacteria group bacterium]
MIKQKIKDLIKDSIKKLQKSKEFAGFDVGEIKVEIPEKEIHGDYSTNIAMIIAKKTNKNPIETAELLTENFKTEISNLFERIKIVKPGFINFFISEKYLQDQIKEILKKKEKFGQLNIGKNKKIQVEFISANPTGPLTLGNARGGAVGDVLANVLKKAGYKTEKAYYINDYGMQILTLGHSVLKDDKAQYKGDYIDYLNKKNKSKDPYKVGEKAAKIIVKEMIKKTTDNFGIKYDEWTSETSFYKSKAVDKVLERLKKKGLIYEKEGALWFKSKKFGDQRDRVVVKEDGWKTYLAGDIAYHEYKFNKKKFDKVINVWGADHFGDILGLQAAVEAIGHKGKLDIIILQFVTLFEKGKQLKMSKRKGTYVTVDELLEEVGKDVARFFFLNKSSDTHLNFDLELAKEQSQKNPVYYVQYAYARICSILKKVKASEVKLDYSLLKHDSEISLIKQLLKFPEIIEDISKDYQVQKLPQYTIDLAVIFHRFYHDCKVLTEDEVLQKARLNLVLATKNVFKNTFDLMGISAPEKM